MTSSAETSPAETPLADTSSPDTSSPETSSPETSSPETLALEIHDTGLRLVGTDPWNPPATSPGYAVFEGKSGFFRAKANRRDVKTGWDAWNQARLRPRFVHHHFWRDLDTVSLPAPFPRDMSTTDLAHRHLKDFWRAARNGPTAEDRSIILTLPSSFSDRQLGLILGLARACEIPVEGMVDVAVAAASGFSAAKLFHLDVHLHQLVLTELRRSRRGEGTNRGSIVRRRVHTSDGLGLIAVIDAAARRLATLCIHATRFDPLHSAESEQKLYLQLPDWLESLRQNKAVELHLERSTGGEVSLKVEAHDLAPALAPFLSRMRNFVQGHGGGQRANLLVTSRLAELPGAPAALEQLIGMDVTILHPDAAGLGALQARESITAPGDDALPFVTRLPIAANSIPTSDPGQSEPEAAPTDKTVADKTVADKTVPTHLVRDGLAYPISGEPFLAVSPWGQGRGPSCRIQQRDGQVIAEVSTSNGSDPSGVFLNDRELRSQSALAVGDQIRVGQTEDRPLELQLIAVVD